MNNTIQSIVRVGFFIILIFIARLIIPKFRHYYKVLKLSFKKIYRVLNVKKRSKIVWEELVKMHKNEKWYFVQFDYDKTISTKFFLKEEKEQEFRYEVTQQNLKFQTFILVSFDENKTKNIMVLASHLNSLLNFGKINVNTKYNYVDFTFSGDLITYMLFPSEIKSDLVDHYDITLDCLWAFSNLIDTNEDPVFVISNLLKRKDEEREIN
jgi:hypothetical protein